MFENLEFEQVTPHQKMKHNEVSCIHHLEKAGGNNSLTFSKSLTKEITDGGYKFANVLVDRTSLTMRLALSQTDGDLRLNSIGKEATNVIIQNKSFVAAMVRFFSLGKDGRDILKCRKASDGVYDITSNYKPIKFF